MDNQQATLIINNDNYFAGLIDSDFGVYISRNSYKGKVQLQPRINFVNTRFNLIELCSSILMLNNINHHIGLEKATIGKDHKRVKIQRLSKCIEFADRWASYCITRRPQLELIKKFCLGRLDYIENFGWKHKNTPYTDEQKDIYRKLCELNLDYNYDTGYRNYTFSWLAGMIDGDGSIYFSVTKRRCSYKTKSGDVNNYEYPKIQPWIKITTGSDTTKNNIIELYSKHGIRHYIDTVESKASKKLGKNKKKFYYSILVKEFNDLLKLISKLDGKLFAKQPQLELLNEYIALKLRDTHNTNAAFEIVKKVKALNNDY